MKRQENPQRPKKQKELKEQESTGPAQNNRKLVSQIGEIKQTRQEKAHEIRQNPSHQSHKGDESRVIRNESKLTPYQLGKLRGGVGRTNGERRGRTLNL